MDTDDDIDLRNVCEKESEENIGQDNNNNNNNKNNNTNNNNINEEECYIQLSNPRKRK